VIDSAALPVFDGEALLIMAFAGCVTRFSLQARVIVQSNVNFTNRTTIVSGKVRPPEINDAVPKGDHPHRTGLEAHGISVTAGGSASDHPTHPALPTAP
jgi:hypothetical protein